MPSSADTPALLLEPAPGDHFLERPNRPTLDDLVLRIEAGEVTAEDFLARVSVDLFGPGVPAYNVAR